jgi:hypothetical protein
MRGASFIGLAFLLALLGLVGWLAYTALMSSSEPLPFEGYLALGAGATFAILIGIGLMTLLFFSSRGGYDEPPRIITDDDEQPSTPPVDGGDKPAGKVAEDSGHRGDGRPRTPGKVD